MLVSRTVKANPMMVSKISISKNDAKAIELGYTFDETRAERVRDFCARFLRHSKGRWAGKPFTFLDWQYERIIRPLYGWYRPDGTRRYRRVGIGVPKKNGKSTLLSALGLYGLCADGEAGAEIYIAAGDREQAGIIYSEAANMVEASPALKKRLKVRRSGKRIMYNKTRSVLRALSSEASTKEGFNIHQLLFDELHTQPNRVLWDTLRYGGASRLQPIQFWISTAGEWDEESLWWEQWDYARKVQNDTIIDPHYLGVIYEATPDDDWTAEATWYKANPSLGETMSVTDMREACEEAKNNPAQKSAFLRYRLDVPTKSISEWLPREAWDKCAYQFDLVAMRGKKTIGSLDLASTRDLIAYVQLIEGGDGFYYVWPTFWCPKREIDDRDKSNKQRFSNWEKLGLLKVTTDEPVADFKVINNDIIRMNRRHPAKQIAIDKWNATQVAYSLRKKLKKTGSETTLTFARFNYATVSSGTKWLENIILSGKLRHPNNPILNWMFGNVLIESDAFGNRRPARHKVKDKIDGIAALILASSVLTAEETEESKYNADDEGLHSV